MYIMRNGTIFRGTSLAVACANVRTRECEDADASTASSVCAAQGTATNPGIFDQNAALTTFGSTGTMQMTIFSEKYTDALFREPSKQCELIPVLLFFQQACQNGPKWTKNAPKGRYHAPDFSLKNAKLRLNIIVIDILRAACVFIAFTFPQPCECVVFQNSDAKESFLPYKSSIFNDRA
jgi:hypothetical protein